MSERLAAADLSGLPDRGLVVVGFSGGADSTALCHWLLDRVDPRRLVLAHVNHQLRGEESQRDEAAAQAFAESQGLRFALLREDVAALARREGLGLEECGRQVRYRFFHSLAPGGGGPDSHRPPRRGQRRNRAAAPVPGSFPARAAGHSSPAGERCCGPFCGCPAGRLRPIAGKTGWPM